MGKLLIFTLFLLTTVIDFRRTEGDQSQLVVILGVANVLFGAMYCLTYGRFTTRLLLWVGAFFLLFFIGMVTGILYGDEFYILFAQATPLLSFSFAVIAAYSIRDVEMRAVVPIIFAVSLTSLVVKVIIGFNYYDLNAVNVRYQIISGSVPLVFCYGLSRTLTKRIAFGFAIMALALFVVFLSVTRTYIIVFSVCVLIAIYSNSKPGSRSGGASSAMVILLSAFAVAIYQFLPDIFERWNDRLSSSRHRADLSGLFRLSEAQFQLDRLFSDPIGLIFGYGHAAKTGLAGSYYIREIKSALGARAVDFDGLGYGHDLYVGLFYVGGLTAGLPVLVALIYLLWRGLRDARRVRLTAVDHFVFVWGLSAFAGYVTDGILSGSFGDRSISFSFGLAAGLLLLATDSARGSSHLAQHLRGEATAYTSTPKQRRAARAGNQAPAA